MPNTYTRLYYHVVFAVKYRRCLIHKTWKIELYKYMAGTALHLGHKIYIINGMPDHIHLLLSAKPTCNLSELIREIKSNSSKWINNSGFSREKFAWQTGFGAFSVSYSDVDRVFKYIENQERHHMKKSFRKEYIEHLDSNDIDYNEAYIFKEI